MRKILRTIDAINDRVGGVARWLCPALVLLITLEVIRRFAFNSPSMWAFETSEMIGATIYVFGWAYVHRYRGHIRVDVFYARLSRRMQALIDVLGNIFLFFPYIMVLTYQAGRWTKYAWTINEKMQETGWYPPFGPLRTVLAIGMALFLLQGTANFIRDCYLLIRNKPYD
jgi:TRAP-type mannitol/chloroaromatic compound transport system permease small subunit